MPYAAKRKRKSLGAESTKKTKNQSQEQDIRVIPSQTDDRRMLAQLPTKFIESETVKDYIFRAAIWLEANYPVHLIGPTGCGKTALAIHLAEKIGNPMIFINGDEETTTTDLVGGYLKVSRNVVADRYVHKVYKYQETSAPSWASNPLAIACKNGYTLIYNEFSRAKPEANNILLSVLEEGVLELPKKFGKDRLISVHPNFRLILTSNSIDYAGVHTPQDALLDRLAAIYMDYYDKETEIEIVKVHTKIKEEQAKEVVTLIRGLRNTLHGPEKPGTRACIMLAQGLKIAKKYGYDERFMKQLCIDAIASKSKDTADMDRKLIIVEEKIRQMKAKAYYKGKRVPIHARKQIGEDFIEPPKNLDRMFKNI